jgi:predicted dienelactone hydrolase
MMIRPLIKTIRKMPPLALAVLSAVLTTLPVKAAEQIYLTYGPLKLSLSVDSLETFAKTGKIDQNLGRYINRATPEQQAKFREALVEKPDIDPLLVSRFFNSELGEDMLGRFGNVINIQGGGNGKYALRGALIQAALDPQDGLSLLNVLKKFPTNIQFSGENLLDLSKAIDKVIKATAFYSETMAKLSTEEAAKNNQVNFAQLPDLRQAGKFGAEKETIFLTDSTRNRKFYVLIYKPTSWREGKTPVMVISHGLASQPEDFGGLAEHLASYGYVVALPQHPGSDKLQAEALLDGFSREVFDSNEFVNRPKDISYTIDELERRNQSEFGGRLDLNNVGIGGHSFGGYTALAIAGAEIDLEYLKQECDRRFSGLNTSLLVQCRALQLPIDGQSFQDTRVTSAIAINPVNSSIFGQKGLDNIQIPVLLGSGNYDPATPAVFEQLFSFVWLDTPEKYLMLVEGQAHVDFSKLDAGLNDVVQSIPKLTLPSPDLLHNYRDALILGFAEYYVAKNEQYRPYLSSSYAAYLSQDQKFKVFLVDQTATKGLEQAIEDFRKKEGRIFK